ncbi:MAG TPA: hypothetical protein VKR58_12740 [Aquella sp.]|nr:hypothetical protein [Aquella sp.]
MSLMKSIQNKSEIKLKISSKVVHELDELRQQAKQRNLELDVDEALEHHLKKLIKKAQEELAKNS